MKFKLINDDLQKTYAVIMDNGDEVMEQLKVFANDQKLRASQFTAIGAFSEATVGFFDFSIKKLFKSSLPQSKGFIVVDLSILIIELISNSIL